MVENQARQLFGFGFQEIGCRSESLGSVPGDSQQELQRVHYGAVIVNDCYNASLGLGHADSLRPTPMTSA